MNREEAIRAMLDGKKVKLADSPNGYAYYDKTMDRPFRWVWFGKESHWHEVWERQDWELVREPRKRPMTRNEVLGFLANTRGIVVMMEGAVGWHTTGTYDYLDNINEYEYAYIDERGNIGEPIKFEVEE